MSDISPTDAKALFDALKRDTLEQIEEWARTFRPNLQQTYGALPGRQLPLGGPSGSGYPAAPHAASHYTTDALDLGSIPGTLTDTQHGNRGGGSLHATATSGAAGFQSAADKAKEDLYPAISGLTIGYVLTATGAATVAFQAITGAPPSGAAGGDLAGTYPNPTIASGAVAFSELASVPTTLSGYGITDAQPLDSDLTAIAALTTTSFGRSLLTQTDAAATRATIGAGTGSGSVTSIDITQPAAGITASGGPITSSGTITLALANDLAALEGLSSTGLAARTGTDTWAQRTITGTSNRLSVTNGAGVAGNPTLDIDSAYVGQASITTLGTISTGVWQGTKVGLAYGGTNADLSATGGASSYLKQASTGAAITVGTIPYTDLTYSGLTTGQVLRATSATATAFGALDLANSNAVTGTLSAARGGTGVSNAGTFTNASNTTITGGGVIALGGFTATIPATDTVAMLGVANVFTADQTVQAASGGAFTLKSTKNGTWSVDEVLHGIEWYSSDTSGTGAGVKAAMRVLSEGTTGATVAMQWYLNSSSVNDVARMRMDSAGRLKIGADLEPSTVPNVLLYTAADGNISGNMISRADTGVAPATLFQRKARGSHASPSVVSSGDSIGRIEWQAYNDDWRQAGWLEAVVESGVGATGADMPAYFRLGLTPDGSATAAEVLRVLSTGTLLIGRTSGLTGAGQLDVNDRCRAATFETANGAKWALQGYTAGAVAQAGYVTVVIDGTTRRLLVG